MLAMNYRGPRRVRIDHKPMPEILHPQDAIVRVTRSCICGSDLHLYNGSVPDTRVGMTFGHEVTGVVEEVGSAVEKLKVGDHVLVPFNIACGRCHFCQQGLFCNCHESNAQATAMGGIVPGDTVVVFGAGPVGLMAAKSAWLFGAARVIVIDHVDYRLEFARDYAPCEAYNFGSLEDPVVFIKRTTDALGADVCIDAVGAEAAGSALQTILGRKLLVQGGSATALHWAINSVKKGGIVSIVGVYGPTDTLVPIGNVVNKGITIRANQASVKRLLPRLIEHVQNGVLDPKAMITHRIPLEDVSDAYRIFSAKLDGCIKPVLMPPST